MKEVNKKGLFVLFLPILLSTFSLGVILGLELRSYKDSNDASFAANPFISIKEYKNENLAYMNLSKIIYILYSESIGNNSCIYLTHYIQNSHFCE